MRLGLVSLLGVVLAWSPGANAAQDPVQRPTFRASVNRVAVAATVRDRRGRAITNLTSEDFVLFDDGVQRQIVEFRSDTAPVSLALLADFSGSMEVASKREAMREVMRHLVTWLTPGTDTVGLFAFDQYLREVDPLSPAPGQVLEKLDGLRPFGKTKLFDAIAETGRRLAAEGAARRAIVALTDGADNASRLSPAEVSGLASEIDVPVYVIVVVSPLDRAGDSSTVIDPTLESLVDGRLGDLARWTGGEIFAAVGPAQTSRAARQIVTELRQQYLIAFEPSSQPGWHPIALRTRDKDHVVRARSGYVVRSLPSAR